MKSDNFNIQNVEWHVPGTKIDPQLNPDWEPDDKLVESFHEDGNVDINQTREYYL